MMRGRHEILNMYFRLLPRHTLPENAEGFDVAYAKQGT
jgi:hypothetical protein